VLEVTGSGGRGVVGWSAVCGVWVNGAWWLTGVKKKKSGCRMGGEVYTLRCDPFGPGFRYLGCCSHPCEGGRVGVCKARHGTPATPILPGIRRKSSAVPVGRGWAHTDTASPPHPPATQVRAPWTGPAPHPHAPCAGVRAGPRRGRWPGAMTGTGAHRILKILPEGRGGGGGGEQHPTFFVFPHLRPFSSHGG
jgi:hypothetical protein